MTRSASSSRAASKAGRQRGGDDLADLVEVVDLEAAGRQRRRADAQAARDHRRARVERDRVAVDRDADRRAGGPRPAGRRCSDSRRSTSTRCTSVPPVRTFTPSPACEQLLGDGLGAVDRALLALAERVRRGDLQRDRLARDHVLERAALLAGEHGRVDLLRVLLAAEDHAAAAAADRLVDRRRDDVARAGPGWGAGRRRRGRRSGPCRPSAARRPRRRSRGSAGSRAGAGRPTSRRRSASACARARSARPRPCR